MAELEADVVVVGAGVVGLACAAQLARDDRSVVVVERHRRPGEELSTHNSGVIHAGLYYPPGSLKAQSCVEGRRLLYERCARRSIPHRRTGKIIVATSDDERAGLDVIEERARAAGVDTLERLDRQELGAREPLLTGVEALWSPESGVVDAWELVASYRAEAVEHDAIVVTHTTVNGLEPAGDRWRVLTENDRGEREEILTACVINCAGLAADSVAAMAGIDVDDAGWRQHPCKGEYFALAGGAPRPETALVYPVPAGPGLGIHLTIDLGGRCLAGPDAHYVDEPSWDVDPSGAERFAAAVARYLPGVRAEHLSPDQASVRPKLSAQGEPFRDYVLADGADHGAAGTIHLVGIESPGLTAAGSLARRVHELFETM